MKKDKHVKKHMITVENVFEMFSMKKLLCVVSWNFPQNSKIVVYEMWLTYIFSK